MKSLAIIITSALIACLSFTPALVFADKYHQEENPANVAVSFAPNGTRLATSGRNHTISIWNPATGEELQAMHGHDDDVTSVAYSPSGKEIASASRDTTIRLWDAATGKELHCLRGHTQVINSIAFTADGLELVSGSSDSKIKVWNAASGKLIRTLSGETGQINSVAVSGDGKKIAAGCEDGSIKLWDRSTCKQLQSLKGHTKAITAVTFSSDSKTLLSGSADKSVRLWNLITGTETHSIKEQRDSVEAVAFSPDGKTFLSASRDWSIRLWSATTGIDVAGSAKAYSVSAAIVRNDNRQRGPKDEPTIVDGVPFWNRFSFGLTSLAWNPNGRLIAAGSLDKTVRIIDAASGQILRTLGGNCQETFCICFSSDGSKLASATADGIINIWDASTGRELLSFQAYQDIGSVSHILFTHDGKKIICNGDDRDHTQPYMHKTIKIWNLSPLKCELLIDGNSHRLDSISLSPDGKIIASGCDDGNVKFWDAQTGAVVKVLHREAGYVATVAFSPRGDFLAGGGSRHNITLWNTETGKLLYTRQTSGSAYDLAFSPDGKELASGGLYGTFQDSAPPVVLWNVADGRKIRSLLGPYGSFSLAFSPDGKFLASSHWGGDSDVSVWNVQTGAVIHTIRNKNKAARCVAFSPDGKFLAVDDGPFLERWNTSNWQRASSFSENTKQLHTIIITLRRFRAMDPTR